MYSCDIESTAQSSCFATTEEIKEKELLAMPKSTIRGLKNAPDKGYSVGGKLVIYN